MFLERIASGDQRIQHPCAAGGGLLDGVGTGGQGAGGAETGLLLVDDGRLALVGNSNRYLTQEGTAPQTVSIISTTSALARQPALVGAVPAGLFPRDLSLDQPAGQVLLANYDSGTVEEFAVPAAS